MTDRYISAGQAILNCFPHLAEFAGDRYYRSRTPTGKVVLKRRGKNKPGLGQGILVGGAVLGLTGLGLLAARGITRNPASFVPHKPSFGTPKSAPAAKISIPKPLNDLADINVVRKNLNNPNHVWEFNQLFPALAEFAHESGWRGGG